MEAARKAQLQETQPLDQGALLDVEPDFQAGAFAVARHRLGGLEQRFYRCKRIADVDGGEQRQGEGAAVPEVVLDPRGKKPAQAALRVEHGGDFRLGVETGAKSIHEPRPSRELDPRPGRTQQRQRLGDGVWRKRPDGEGLRHGSPQPRCGRKRSALAKKRRASARSWFSVTRASVSMPTILSIIAGSCLCKCFRNSALAVDGPVTRISRASASSRATSR